jgi:hypothetical protein
MAKRKPLMRRQALTAEQIKADLAEYWNSVTADILDGNDPDYSAVAQRCFEYGRMYELFSVYERAGKVPNVATDY